MTAKSKPTVPAKTTAEHVRKSTIQPGWLLPQIQMIDQAFSKRWIWWIDRLYDEKIGDHQIPQIDFHAFPSRSSTSYPVSDGLKKEIGHGSDIKKQFLNVVNRARLEGVHTGTLLQWFLHGLECNGTIKRPNLSDDLEVLMYQDGVQSLVRMMGIPGDWAAEIMCEIFDGSKSGTAWFPTPGSLTNIMNQIVFSDSDQDTRAHSAHDPCCGTGVMLLNASNHCLDLSGQDIDQTMCYWAKLQGYLFVPWLVYGNTNSIEEIRLHRHRAVYGMVKTNIKRTMPKRARKRINDK